AARIQFGEPALSARQALLGSCQQPFDRLRSVAFDDISIVVLTAVKEDAEIELRGGVTAFGSKPEVPHRTGFHLGILPNRRAGKLRRCCMFRAGRRWSLANLSASVTHRRSVRIRLPAASTRFS